jgi:membrane fusion protein (multidrug efflux system)
MTETTAAATAPAPAPAAPGPATPTPAKPPAAPAAPELAHHEPVIRSEKARRLYFILGGAVVILLIGYAIYAFVTAGRESTDDAQISADIVPVAARISGQIVNIYVQENSPVRKGQLIADIDPGDAQVKVNQAMGDYETAKAQATQADAQASVAEASARGGFTTAQAAVQTSRETVDASKDAIAEARAGVTHAEANAQKARLDFQRATELGGKGDIPRAQVDAARAANETAQADVVQARARLKSAEDNQQHAESSVHEAEGKLTSSSAVPAQIAAARAMADLAHAKIKTAEAALAAAQLTLSYTKVYAPADGFAAKLAVHPGQLITPGQPICTLVPAQTYIVANFKETQLRQMKAGQKADIIVDVAKGKKFEGRVESLSGGTGASFSLLPPDNASGNFVKVVQRVPVRLSWNGPPSAEAPVGSSAEVTVLTK